MQPKLQNLYELVDNIICRDVYLDSSVQAFSSVLYNKAFKILHMYTELGNAERFCKNCKLT